MQSALRRLLVVTLLGAFAPSSLAQTATDPKRVKLPPPSSGPATLDRALQDRKTTRTLAGPALSLAEAAQLLWSAQGENRPGKRTVPSANARYPLELYYITTGNDALVAGSYKYLPKDHTLTKVSDRGVPALFGAIQGMQSWIAQSPAVFLFTGVPTRMAGSDASRREAYTFWEAGAATQALLLEATALGLGSGVASGVDFDAIKAALALPADEKPIVLVPVGRSK